VLRLEHFPQFHSDRPGKTLHIIEGNISLATFDLSNVGAV
jgi:hypothetical protein